MIAIEKTNNTGKLLVAIMAMALVIVGASVVFSDDVQAVDWSDVPTEANITSSDFLGLDTDNDGVIVLEDDYILTTSIAVTKDLTVDLNGHSITSSVTTFVFAAENVSLTVLDSTGNGGIISYEYILNGSNPVCGNNSLTVNGGTYTVNETSGFAFIVGQSTNGTAQDSVNVSISNATISGYVGIWLSYYSINSAMIENCIIDVTDTGIYLGTVKDSVVRNCEITVSSEGKSTGSALEIKSGEAKIEGCTISSDTYDISNTTINHNGAGGPISTVAINDGYCGVAGVSYTNVFIDKETTIENTSTVDDAKPVVIAHDADTNRTIYVAWEDKTDYYTNTDSNKATTIGTLVSNNEDGTVNADDVNSSFTETVKDVAISNGTITSGTTLIIPEDGTLTISSDVTIENGASFDVANNGNVVMMGASGATFTVTGGSADDKSNVSFSNVTGNLIIAGGSVHISGEFTGTLEVSGEVYINGTITGGNATIIADGTDVQTVTTDGNITIDEGASLTISANVKLVVASGHTLSNNGTMSVNGALDTSAISVSNLGNVNGTGQVIASSNSITGMDFVARHVAVGGANTYYLGGTPNIEMASGEAVAAGSLITTVTVTYEDSEIILGKSTDWVSANRSAENTNGLYLNGNIIIDSIEGSVVIAPNSTVIVNNLTIGQDDLTNNGGAIIVTGTLTYTGTDRLDAFSGIPQVIQAYNLYLADGARYTGYVYAPSVTDPVTGVIVNSISAANDRIADTSASSVTIVSLVDVDVNGLEGRDGVTVTIGSVIGSNANLIGTIVSNDIDATLNGVYINTTTGTGITVTGTNGAVEMTGTGVTATVGEDGYAVDLNSITSENGFTLSVTEDGIVQISGDLVLNGNATTEVITGNDLIITGNTSITGNGTISVHELVIAQGATLTIGQNVVIKINGTTDDTLVVNTGATITGDGYIQLTGASSGITNNGTIDVEVRVDPSASTIEVGSPTEFVNALPYYTNIKVTDVLDFASDSEEYPASISVENKVITISDDAGFNIGEGVTISFIGTTINVASDADAYTFTVDPKAFLVIDDSDIYANVEVEEQSLTLRNNVTNIDGSSIYLTSVGFGKIINFNNNYNLGSGSELTVYGTLNVASGYTLTVGNATVDVQSSGVINVAGTLNMAGTMKVYGTVEVTGEMNMTGTLTIDIDGEVDVSGTTAVSGTLSGVIDNHGTITFAGTVATGAGVDMYPGSSLTVTSMAAAPGVATGLTVTGATSYVKPADADTNKDYIPPVENTSSITLTGVSGVVITADETVTTQPYAQDEKKTQEVYTVTLDISGSAVTSTEGEIETDITNGGKVTIEQTLDLAKGVNMVFGDGTADVDYVINGTLNAADGATITNNGTITVVGEITTVGATAVAVSNVNGVYYDVTTAASGTSSAYVTRTYTSLATAVDVTNADNGTIYAVGTITVDADSSITVPATLKLSSTAAITVKGTLVFSDYETSYLTKTNEIKSDVLIDEAPVRTYTSLANAIGMGVTEIVLNDDVTIESDLTIPAGVTVSSDEYGVSVGTGKSNANVTLTVEGALELTGTSIAEDNHDGIRLVTGQTVGTTTYQGRLVLGGTGYVYTVNSTELEDLVAGAYYQKLPSETASTPVNVIATIDRAAADSENVYASSGAAAIDIHGAVSTTSDLTFTAAEDVQLKVTVQADSTDEDDIHASSLTAPSVTIVGDVSIMTNDADTDGKSATISTTVVFGDSSVILAGINSVSITTTEIEEVTYLSMNVAATSGTATVQSGNVIVSGSVSGTTAGGATIAVANGATMTVSSIVTIDEYGRLNVEGTMAVAVKGKVTIDENGTANVTGQVTVTGDMDVLGTLNVDGGTVQTATAENSDTPGTIDITGTAVVGTKPTSIGFTSTGTLTGTQVTGSGIVKAYNGASVTMLANTDGTSTAVSTVLNIRAAGGEYFAYMTVYAQTGNSTVKVFENVINKEIFALEGYDTGLFYKNESVDNSGLFKYGNWYTSSDRVENTALTADVYVGSQNNTALYAQVDLVSVSITVSEGTGLNLYIDDIAVNSGSVSLPIGTHTVRFDVQAQYDGSDATITFNGQTVANGGTIEVTTGSAGYVLACSGAVPAQSGSGDITVNVPSQDDGMSLTDILLIVLVILIVIMAIIVALRLMRS